MKKSLLLFILYTLLFPTSLFSQKYAVGHEPSLGTKYYYVGSIEKHTTTPSRIPHAKLKIDIFGGNIYNSNLGVQTFTISTRNGLKINKEINYGGTDIYTLEVFETSIEYEFAIKVTTSSHWASIGIQSWCLNPKFNGQPTEITPITIREYDPTEKNNVTAQFLPTTILATTNTGDIGIGTDSPKAKLDVRGKIIANEVEIKVNKGADFVFDPDYNLKTLSEVENFINENKHLPEIPSEREMQENGLNVNEMQIKLLQKIEELTLYVIELKKENEEQSKRIEKQEDIIKKLQLK